MEIVVTHTEAEALLLEMQPDQAPDAALQRAAARRQVVSLYPSDRRPRLPAAHQVPRRARQGRRLFRPLRLGRRGQPHARSRCRRPSCCARAATACSRAARGPACSTRSSAAARPASAASTSEDYAALVERGARLPRRPEPARCSSASPARWRQPSDGAGFRERRRCIRDRIRALSAGPGRTRTSTSPAVGDADVIAAHQAGGQTCVQVFFFRGGQNWGNRAYFPSHDRQLPVEEVLTAFVGQFYDNRPAAQLILLSHDVAEQRAGRRGAVACGRRARSSSRVPQRGDKKRAGRPCADQRARGARPPPGRERARSASCSTAWRAAFGLDGPPERIEVYDNSHIQGTQCGRRDDRRRARGLRQERLPQVQHQDRGAHAGRRLRA